MARVAAGKPEILQIGRQEYVGTVWIHGPHIPMLGFTGI